MKKMRKFAWIFMAAMTVAGFSACNNTEDEPLPGLPGDDDNNDPVAPSYVVKDTIYQFNNIEAEYTPINELCEGWAHEIISPADDDRTWQSKMFTNSTTNVTEKYIQATAHDSTNGNDGLSYDWWMITPALDVKNAVEKVCSFYSEIAYWKDDTKLEVWVLSEQSSEAKVAQLNPTLADNTNPGGNFKGWVASGDLDLSTYGDVVYIGFHYTAQGGKSKSTTYCIDDFAFGRKQVEHYVGETPSEPDTPVVDDWSDAVTVAQGLEVANEETYAVKGYIVGCIKNNPSETKFSSFADAQAAGDIEWAGATEFTGYSQVFIADTPDETDGSKCILVKLNDTSAAKDLRSEVNLDANPDKIGALIYVRGLKKANFGLPGIRNITEYKVVE